ncbi:MAG: hypothetical protein KKH51_11700 [Actinobacteria bacterium]|nr:hypothetical protein [Actinomycetota bacterium]
MADYFGAVATGDPAALQDVATRLTAPGSNAYAYAIEQGAASQAYRDGGFPDQPSEMETNDDGFSVCGTNELTGDRSCNDFTNLTYADGKLADFDAGGAPLAGRISLGSGDVVALGSVATARLIAAYRTISGSVNVVLEIKSSGDGVSVGYGSSYQAPDGRQSDASGVIGPNQLQAGSLGNYLIAFDGATFGGTLRLVGYDSAYNEISAQIATAPSP